MTGQFNLAETKSIYHLEQKIRKPKNRHGTKYKKIVFFLNVKIILYSYILNYLIKYFINYVLPVLESNENQL